MFRGNPLDSETTFVMKETGQKVELMAVFDSPEGRALEVELPSGQRLKVKEEEIVSKRRYLGTKTGVLSLWFTGGLTAGISAMLADLESWFPSAETLVSLAILFLAPVQSGADRQVVEYESPPPINDVITEIDEDIVAEITSDVTTTVAAATPDVQASAIRPRPRPARIERDGIIMEQLPK